MLELTGVHMEKAFNERVFQTNYNVCVEKVSYKSLMGVPVFYEFRILRSSQTNKIVRSKQTPRKTPAGWLLLYSKILN